MSLPNPYLVLGLPVNADAAAIKHAHSRFALLFHPDKLQSISELDKQLTEQTFQKIQQAYEILIDPVKRAAFNAHGTTSVSFLSPFSGNSYS